MGGTGRRIFARGSADKTMESAARFRALPLLRDAASGTADRPMTLPSSGIVMRYLFALKSCTTILLEGISFKSCFGQEW